MWGEAVLAEARPLNRPILLSIGYAACHWCHVMAHESFEDAGVAAVMNELFINIKVDRDERPDIDQVYMSALRALDQPGRWPLTMFLTPAFPNPLREGVIDAGKRLQASTRNTSPYLPRESRTFEHAESLYYSGPFSLPRWAAIARHQVLAIESDYRKTVESLYGRL
jgi:Protein of unknown function, DUF255